ncbi:hypothetical protein B0T17DRAFT_503618 [Bombardia bombarda]|uniref:NB-ARC domain-containing protein n=1 Tax=Bombardia bombarda TaxID=252184 RepID=A0AA40CG60_9PEZI|nr:hypothetical protein B0T17DRAFT_503618 [Bombardia bombarda]
MQASEITWGEAATRRAAVLARVAPKTLLPSQFTREIVEEMMQELQKKYSSRRTTKWFVKMQGVLTHMRTFSEAITIFTQSDPIVSSLVWGSVKLIIDAASTLSHTLHTVIGMLESMSRAMPRFEEYMKLYSGSQRLQDALLRIYCGYLDFCASAVKFFSVNIIVHISRSFFFSGSLTIQFKNVIEEITSASRDFGEEAQLAHVVNTKSQLIDIREALDYQPLRQYATSLFSVPWARNDRFLGREQDLQALAQHLEPNDGSRQRSCVLHGMAGVGKTQAALEFCYRQKSTFSYIIWLPSQREAVLADMFSKITRLVRGPVSPGENATTVVDSSPDVDASHLWLCQNTLRSLQSHVDPTCNSATFHYEKPPHSAFDVSLNTLSSAAMGVLQVISMLSPDAIPESLLLGELEDPSLRFGGYADKFQQVDYLLFFLFAAKKFRRDIRTPLIRRHLVDFHEPMALGDSHSYSIHRQLQKKVINSLSEEYTACQLAFDRSVALVKLVFPPLSEFMVPVPKDLMLYKKSIAQAIRLDEVFRICSKASHPLVGGLAFAELLVSAGYYLFEARLGAPGLMILSTAEDICTTSAADTPDYPSSARSLEKSEKTQASTSSRWIKLRATALQISWAIMITSNGWAWRKKCTKHIMKVLELRKAYATADYGEDTYIGRVLLANALNDMACQLLDNAEFDAAEAHLAASIKMKEDLSCERSMPPYQFAEHKKNMALVRLGQKKEQEAVVFSKEAIAFLSKEEGEDGVYSIFLFTHGICLANAGCLPAALSVLQKSHKLRAASFGSAGIHTLHNLYAIAFVQYRMGLHSEARHNIEKCRLSQEDACWPTECGLRADYLLSLIKDQRGATRAALLERLQTTLNEYSPEILSGRDISSLSDLDHAFLFDFIVPIEAGRFAAPRQLIAAPGP